MFSSRLIHCLGRISKANHGIPVFVAKHIPQNSTNICFSSSSERGDKDGYPHDDEFWGQPSKVHRHRFPQYRNQKPDFRKKRTAHYNNSDYFDDYFGGDQLEQPSFESSGWHSDTKELGANLKRRNWDTAQLPPVEKNFFIEHESLANRTQEEIDAFYTENNITVTRGKRPIPILHFREANFPEELNYQLQKNGLTKPTAIQSLGWPLVLSGKNMVGIAQTGSGKTLGFALPSFVHIKHQSQVLRGEGPIVLVLAPTRELAQQIKSVLVQYGRRVGIRSCCLFGGQSKLIQARHVSEGPEIVVATPGRLLDFLEMDVINLDRTTYVVLDEADRMLDMGFEPQIRKILGQIRPDRQMLMWSATWPREIQELAHDFLGDFTQVNIGSAELMANPNILQTVKVCERREKPRLLIEALEKEQSERGNQKTLIFTQTKTQADLVTHKLRHMRFRALAIHGDKSQLVRDKTLHSFRNGETEILVATDVASRGLDVDDINLVVNFDYPNTADDYIHRIGRTARASKTGTALSFITPADAGKVPELIKVLKEANQDIPQDLQHLVQLNAKFTPQRSSNRPKNFSGFNRRTRW